MYIMRLKDIFHFFYKTEKIYNICETIKYIDYDIISNLDIKLTNYYFKTHITNDVFLFENYKKISFIEVEANLNSLIKKVEKFYPIIKEFKKASEEFMTEVNINKEIRDIKLNSIIK